MDYIDAYNLFKDCLSLNEVKIIKEDEDKICVDGFPETIIINKKIINAFKNYIEKKKEFYVFKDLGLYNSNYCELRIFPISLESFSLVSNKNNLFIGEENSLNKIFIKIGIPSIEFIFYLFLNGLEKRIFPRFFKFYSEFIEDKFIGILVDYYTIKIYNHNLDITKKSFHKNLLNLCQSSLFEISVKSDLNFKLGGHQSTDKLKLKNKQNDKPIKISEKLYDFEVISYYFMGIQENHSLLSYLSFYHVFENYFLQVSNYNLILKIKYQLENSNFNINDENNLLNFSKNFKNFKIYNKEQEQLKMVLERFITIDSFNLFIQKLDNELKEHFLGNQKIFNKSLKIVLNESKFYDSLAKRIYNIRCAIVHSKKNIKEDRYLPTEYCNKILSLENPLMRFLSEEIIINNPVENPKNL